METTESEKPNKSRLSTCILIALLVIAVVVGALIYAGYSTQLLNILPFVVLLACPLMHVFMHRRHRHGDGSGEKQGKKKRQRTGGCH